jgi:hypothetical protein
MLTTPPYRIPQGTTIGCATCDYLLAMLSICKNKFASCFATSLGRHKLATSNLSAVCRVLRIALRTAILKKYNCRTTFGRSSHNGLLPTGLSAVLLTVPFLLDNLCYDMFRELYRVQLVISKKTGTVKGHNLNPVDFWIK